MSGGTTTQNFVLLTLIAVVAVGIVGWVLIGRRRRAWATGSQEAGSVRSRGQAEEIAERLYTYCAGDGAADGGTAGPRVRVTGAARLLKVLSADDRFDVTPRASGENHWSFVVKASGGGHADGEALGRGVAGILERNGVTAVAAL